MIRPAVRRAVLAAAATLAAGLAVPATATPAAAAPPPAAVPAAARAAVPAAARAAAPVATRPAAPRPPKTRWVTGTYARLAKDHLDAHGDLRHEYEDVLRVPGKAIRLRLPRGHALKPGSRIRVSALRTSGGTLDVRSYQRVAPAALPPAGTASVIVILAYWTRPDSVTQASATAKVFGDAHKWFKEVSYGKAGLTGVVTPWVRIPAPAGGRCYADAESILANARDRAGRLGGKYLPTQYQRTIVYFPRCSGDAAGVAGWAYEPGDSAWLNGYLDRRTIVHEQGHNHGLGHARALACTTSGGARTMFSRSCTSAVYGDPYDAMGRSSYAAHYTGFRKDQLGWLGSRKRVLTTSSATFTLPPFEKPSSLPNVVVAQSNRVYGRSYWLEYRRPVGMDARLPAGATGGVVVHLQEPSRPGWLLDGTPSDGTFSTAVIKAGRSWTAPDYLKISVGSISSTGARVTVSGARPAPVAPSAPRNVVAAPDDGGAVVTWSAPASDGRAAITAYVAVLTTADGERIERNVEGYERDLALPQLRNGVTYAVRLVARNEAGASPPAYTSVTPYAMTPSVRLTSPLAGATLTGAVTLTATAAPHPVSGSPVECVTFFVDDVSRGSDCHPDGGTYSAPWQSGTVSNGPHQVRATVSDAAGRSGTDGPYAVEVDNPRPVLTWVTPATGAVIDADRLLLEVRAALPSGADVQIAELTFYDTTAGWYRALYSRGHYYDPQTYYWMTNSALPGPHAWQWDVTHLDGPRTLVAQVRDLDGVVTRSAPIEITIDHPPTTIAISSPGASVSGPTTTVSADVVVAPGRSVDHVRFSAGGRYLGEDRTAPYELPWDISAIGGYYRVDARLVETSGRTYDAFRYVTVANVPPRVTVTSPGNYVAIGPVVHQFGGTATAGGSGGEAPDRVVVSVDGAVVATVPVAADGTWSVPWDATGLFGYHSFSAKALTPGGLAATYHGAFYVVHPRPVTTLHSPEHGSAVLADVATEFVLSATPRSDDPTTVTTVCVAAANASGCATTPGDDGRYRVPLTLQGFSGSYWTRATIQMSDGWTHTIELPYFYLARPPRAPAAVAVTGAPGALTVEVTAPPSTEPIAVTGYVVSAGDRTVTVPSAGTTTTTTVTGLTDGTAYDVAVRAVNDLGTGAATPGTGRPGAATRLVTVTAPPSSVVYGSRATWTARLTDAAGAGLAGRTVALDSCVPASNTAEEVCTEAGTGGTAADGSVSVSAEVTSRAVLRLRYAGDGTTGSGSLRSALLSVTPRLVLTAPASVAAGSVMRVQSDLQPSGYGYLYLEFRRAGAVAATVYLGYHSGQTLPWDVSTGGLALGDYTVRLTLYDYWWGNRLYSAEQPLTLV